MDPYEALGVSPQADDDTIRKAYLELVRRFSPDSDPDAFKRISRPTNWSRMKNYDWSIIFLTRMHPATRLFMLFCSASG